MNKKRVLALMGASLATMTLTTFAATPAIPKSATLQEVQQEISSYENQYAASANAYEAAANVPAPDYIRNGTAAPGLVTTIDPQTTATASIIMGQTNTPNNQASSKMPETSTGTTNVVNTDESNTNSAPTLEVERTSSEALQAAQSGYYQGRKVISVVGNVITVEGDNTSAKPARYATADEAALPDASHVALPVSAPKVGSSAASAPTPTQAPEPSPAPATIPLPESSNDDLKAIITDPKNAQNKPMDTAVYTAAMANASK